MQLSSKKNQHPSVCAKKHKPSNKSKATERGDTPSLGPLLVVVPPTDDMSSSAHGSSALVLDTIRCTHVCSLPAKKVKCGAHNFGRSPKGEPARRVHDLPKWVYRHRFRLGNSGGYRHRFRLGNSDSLPIAPVLVTQSNAKAFV